WYWPVDNKFRSYHYCQLASGHAGEHICKDGAQAENVREMST
ncbi:MAG: hypothetical protein QOE00_2896, partial [Ilumatobacteraceae bacterium]